MSAARVRDIRKRLSAADPETLERLLLLMEPTAKPASVRSADDSAAHLRPLLVGLEVEHFAIVFLTRHLKVIACEVLSKGGADHTIVCARTIFRRAIVLGAYGIVMGHNHPSGELVASSADLAVTRRMVDAGALLGIEVMDHLIVTNGGHVSMAQLGQMPGAKSAPF